MYFLPPTVQIFLEIPGDCVYTPFKGLKGSKGASPGGCSCGHAAGGLEAITDGSYCLPRKGSRNLSKLQCLTFNHSMYIVSAPAASFELLRDIEVRNLALQVQYFLQSTNVA